MSKYLMMRNNKGARKKNENENSRITPGIMIMYGNIYGLIRIHFGYVAYVHNFEEEW